MPLMADEKQYISRIRLSDGTTVDIKDQEARLELESLLNNEIKNLIEQFEWGRF